jgi:hypothetical protein
MRRRAAVLDRAQLLVTKIWVISHSESTTVVGYRTYALWDSHLEWWVREILFVCMCFTHALDQSTDHIDQPDLLELDAERRAAQSAT